MSKTLINLDKQAIAKYFSFGGTTAGTDALVTINAGTTSLSTNVLMVGASASILGDLNLSGNLNITGAINEQTVTNLAVSDINITLNKGGTSVTASGAGILIEGDSGSVIDAIKYLSTSPTKFTIGNGTSQANIVDESSVQTLTNKLITGIKLHQQLQMLCLHHQLLQMQI